VFVDFEERDFGRRRPAANDSIFHARFQKKKKRKKPLERSVFSFVFAAPLPSSNDTGKTKCEVMCTTGSEIDDCQCARIF
jgi:hypothetical protein